MNVTLKNKAAQKQLLIKKVMNLKIVAGAVSKQIKDCFEPPPIPSKNINIINYINITSLKSKKLEPDNQKHSLQTTASSFSTRHQSAQKYRKITIPNPQTHILLKQQRTYMQNKNNAYTIKWRNPVSNISKSMRVILGQWLMQLSSQLQMPKDTVYNAMHYTDKYVGMVNVSRSKYQSIGLCALFIASKLELSNHPNIGTFVEAMDGTITKSELIQLEQNMVLKLRFRLNPPTLYQYMVLVVSLFNHFIAKKNLNLTPITPNTEIYKDLFWMLDGIHLDNEYKNFHNKQKICLGVLYLSLKKSKSSKTTMCLKKLYTDLQTLKQQGQLQKIFQSFLTTIIQIFKKLSQLKDCITYYRKWIRYQRLQSQNISQQIQQLKNIILND